MCWFQHVPMNPTPGTPWVHLVPDQSAGGTTVAHGDAPDVSTRSWFRCIDPDGIESLSRRSQLVHVAPLMSQDDNLSTLPTGVRQTLGRNHGSWLLPTVE